jgi:uncharacterized membrane protein YciS (DUF1049 family)
MWAIRMLLIIIFLIVSIGFFVSNANERVDVNILHTRYVDVPLMIVLLIAFGIGMVASFLIAVTYFFRISSEAAGNKRMIKRLQAEITALRNRQIDQIDSV